MCVLISQLRVYGNTLAARWTRMGNALLAKQQGPPRPSSQTEYVPEPGLLRSHCPLTFPSRIPL